MTKKEAAIVQAFSGVVMLVGEDEQVYREYVDELMKRHVEDDEIDDLKPEIRSRACMDFIRLCLALK